MGVLIAMLVSFGFKNSVIVPERWCNILLCVIDNLPLTLVSVYAPYSHQLRFLLKVFRKLSQVRVGNIVTVYVGTLIQLWILVLVPPSHFGVILLYATS